MKKITFILLALSALFLITCKKAPELKVYDVNFVSENVDVSSNSATITIHYSYLTKLDYVNAYVSKSNYFGDSSVVPAEVNDSIIIISFNDLQPGTKYYYKYDYSNGLNTATSDVKTFNIGGSSNDPIVTTYAADQVTMTTVKLGASATPGPGQSLTSFNFGFCWSTNANPTMDDSYVIIDKADQDFSKILVKGLQPGTKYYVRAFIENFVIYYGNTISFTTYSDWGGGTPSEGYINGEFSISETQKIWFSKGNLQYQASTNTYRFAESQLEMIWEESDSVSPTYNGWIDIYPFGTSGWYSGTHIDNYPYDIDGIYTNAYSDYVKNMNGDNQYADWGIFNPISNGGNVRGQWRCITSEEMRHIMYYRTTSSGILYAYATINDVCGVIIFPDNWNASLYSSINTDHSNYTDNIISISDWNNIFEANGVAFFPTKYSSTSGYGGYRFWGKSCVPIGKGPSGNDPLPPYKARLCVRLVHDID